MTAEAPWLPVLPDRWEIVQMRRLVTFRNGADYKDVEVDEGGFPVYGSGGEFRRASSYVYDGPSVLFGRKGTIDRPLLVSGKFWTVDTMFYTELGDAIEPRFLHHYATTMPFSYYSTSTALPSMTQGELGGHRMPLPPLEEQRAIANYLDRETARIDTLIEEQQRLIEMLRERRVAVLSAAFDIGPSTEGTKVGRLLAARPSYGVLVPRYVDEAEGVPFVRVGDLLNLTPERPMPAIASKQSDEYSRTKIVGGEVLLGVVGKMGQAALAPQWLAGANVARAVAVLRCKDPAMAPLLCAWLGSNNFLYQAELATSGDSIQPTLGMKDLAQFDINLPTNPNAAADLASRLTKIDALIEETERFIELARERRAALITAAVTGQIDVREMA